MEWVDFEKKENKTLDEIYYYMLYFDFSLSHFKTKNRPPCKTKAEIKVRSVKYMSYKLEDIFKGGKEARGERQKGTL